MRYYFLIHYMDCKEKRELIRSKPDYLTEKEARLSASEFVKKHYPELDSYHLVISVGKL